MAPKWSDEMNLKFVELYKEQRCLWDQRDELYKDKNARETALVAIADCSSLSSVYSQRQLNFGSIVRAVGKAIGLKYLHKDSNFMPACVKLCSQLVNKPLSLADIKRCLSLVVSVLRKCRHKGAIESAGLALNHITKNITISGDEELQALPDGLLEEFLQSVVSCTASTVSRRSAGLAILVHKLITGDNRPQKPLLHRCIAALLPIASDSSSTSEDGLLVDLPQSQAMHFLRTLVQESSLREHMAQYTLSISLVALNCLASPVWTVRNAALQLFGALVPKLVGQKPHQEDGKGHHHLSLEELYFHAKPLVEMMLSELSSAASSTQLQGHSKLMPILTLVSNLTLGIQGLNSKELSEVVSKFQQSFQQLFKSSIFNVRKLSAKASSLFLTSYQLFPALCERIKESLSLLEGRKSVIQSENEFNGFILNLYFLFERYNDDKVGMKMILQNEEPLIHTIYYLSTVILTSKYSSFTKSIAYDLLMLCKSSKSNIVVSSCREGIGYPQLLHKRLTHLILNKKVSKVNKTLELCLLKKVTFDVHLSCLTSLLKLLKLKKESLQGKPIVLSKLFMTITKFLLQKSYDEELFGLSLQVMINILELPTETLSILHNSGSLSSQFLSRGLWYLLSPKTTVKVSNLLLPVIVALLSIQEVTELSYVEHLATIVKKQSDPSSDEDARLYAAKSLLFFIPLIKKNKMFETVWEASVNFLQDEVTQVRYEASKFVTVLSRDQQDSVWNPYLSLEHMFESSFIVKFMTPSNAFMCLWNLMVSYQSVQPEKIILNPFDHEVKNIYAEKSVVSYLAYRCILDLSKRTKDDELLRVRVEEVFDTLGTANIVPNNVKCYIKEIKSSFSIGS